MKEDAKAVLKALADARSAGKPFKIVFQVPGGGGKPKTGAKPADKKADEAAAGANAAEEAAAAAAAAAAKAAEEAAAKLEAERKEKGNGTITLKYSTYTEEFTIVDGGLLSAEVDARFCLSFVMPGCAIHVSEMSVSDCTRDQQMPPEEQTFCYLPETEGIKGTIEVTGPSLVGAVLKPVVTRAGLFPG